MALEGLLANLNTGALAKTMRSALPLALLTGLSLTHEQASAAVPKEAQVQTEDFEDGIKPVPYELKEVPQTTMDRFLLVGEELKQNGKFEEGSIICVVDPWSQIMGVLSYENGQIQLETAYLVSTGAKGFSLKKNSGGTPYGTFELGSPEGMTRELGHILGPQDHAKKWIGKNIYTIKKRLPAVMTTRILRFKGKTVEERGIAVHGTNARLEPRLGQKVSGGCVRMGNQAVAELAADVRADQKERHSVEIVVIDPKSMAHKKPDPVRMAELRRENSFIEAPAVELVQAPEKAPLEPPEVSRWDAEIPEGYADTKASPDMILPDGTILKSFGRDPTPSEDGNYELSPYTPRTGGEDDGSIGTVPYTEAVPAKPCIVSERGYEAYRPLVMNGNAAPSSAPLFYYRHLPGCEGGFPTVTQEAVNAKTCEAYPKANPQVYYCTYPQN